jgi:hypothetical protein
MAAQVDPGYNSNRQRLSMVQRTPGRALPVTSQDPGKREATPLKPDRTWVARMVAIALFVAGAVGFLGGLLLQAAPIRNGIGTTTELPLGTVRQFATDSGGTIYMASQGLNAIQVYSPDGAFVRRIWVDPQKGGFRIRVDEDRLKVAVAKTGKVYRLSPASQLQEAERDDEALWKFNQPDRTYELVSPRYWPTLQDRKSGRVIVQQPFGLWFFGFPRPAFFWAVAGGAGLAIARRLSLRHRSAAR